LLTVQALVGNPLDWQHFYEKISAIKRGDRTDFMVVTAEGDRLAGAGDVVDIEKWSNHGQYGFKIKIDVKKQKSLTDRRTRAPKIAAPPKMMPEVPVKMPAVTAADIASFKEMPKGSLAMDISA
ncbi:MAG: hypothetical protein ABI347_10350, partial [Nitrososphaera sp.]